MAQNNRPEPQPVVNIPFAVKIINVTVFGIGHDWGIVISPITKVGVYAVRDNFLGAFKKLM
jgi:hypothetical protein